MSKRGEISLGQSFSSSTNKPKKTTIGFDPERPGGSELYGESEERSSPINIER